MIIIEKNKNVEKKKYCKKCGSFLFKIYQDGTIKTTKKASVSLWVKEDIPRWEVGCKCGEKIFFKII